VEGSDPLPDRESKNRPICERSTPVQAVFRVEQPVLQRSLRGAVGEDGTRPWSTTTKASEG